MLAFIASIILTLSAAASQEEPRRFLDPQTVPAEGRAPEDFVPRGWKLEGEVATGDLNRDGSADAVLRVVEDLALENKEGVVNTRHRALVILFARPSGGYERAAVGPKLLYCSTCGGMLSDPSGASTAVEIKSGVLVVTQLSGAREATDFTQRFRYDPAARRFRLIGEDSNTYDRLTGESVKVSTNLLTGLRVSESYKVRTKGGEPVLVSTKRERVAAAKRFFEDVDYEQ
ncbi:MAG TPA: hypothetical protein VGX48_16805 [Pyrinomonadaceae bacterium]|jgi:hypothetical protein|nr:hypothetical protein [Pyrinomonadaceae bacterium]